MKLNTLKPQPGSRPSRTRVGRGIGSGLGKTAGRGHKGQTSRAGGYHKVGFEGGQMPLQRRLPKIGFASPHKGTGAELRLYQLAVLDGGEVTMAALRTAGLIGKRIKTVKLINTGEVTRPYKVSGIAVTRGAREAIVKAGGSVA